MSRSMLIQIGPEILRYARKYSGYSIEEVSKKTKIPVEKLNTYEDQKTEIPLTHLEKFSNVYKRPLAFFLLEKTPVDAVEPKDFRIIYDSEEVSFSPPVYIAIRRARYIQSVLSEIAQTDFDYPFEAVSIGGDIEKIASSFRDYLGVNVEEQGKWKNPSEALRAWRNKFEEKNLFVIQQPLTNEDISAFCLVDKKPYVIVLNSSEHENRRIFSLFHEIGHIFLQQSGICTPDDLSRYSYKYVQIEKFCNQFASSFLMPKKDFMSSPSVISLLKKEIKDWEDDDLYLIAREFRVSQEAVLRRFLTLGFVSEKFYQNWRNQRIKKWEEYKSVKRKGFAPQHLKCLSQNGRGLASFVFGQYHNHKITFSSAAEILNINPKHMSRLEAAL